MFPHMPVWGINLSYNVIWARQSSKILPLFFETKIFTCAIEFYVMCILMKSRYKEAYDAESLNCFSVEMPIYKFWWDNISISTVTASNGDGIGSYLLVLSITYYIWGVLGVVRIK